MSTPKPMSPRVIAAADQDFSEFTAMLHDHVGGLGDLMDAEGYDDAEAFVRLTLALEDREQYDPRQVARLAAAAVVRLAAVRREIRKTETARTADESTD